MKEKINKLLALKAVKGYGNKRIVDLIRSFGSLDRVYSTFLSNALINEDSLTKYEEISKICKRDKIKIISYFDEEYPSNLRGISSPPLVLFVKGNLKLFKMPSISIVGTREASEKTLKWTHESSRKLANLDKVIISGGARGVDFEAHKGALDETGNTICILGSGLKNIYPKENLQLIQEIFQRGLVISEYPPEHHVSRVTLLERNRITSGLGDKLLLVATKLTGGAMSQYKVALSQGKERFCPHPNLKLDPIEGIKQIIQADKQIKVINKIEEIFNFPEREEPQRVLKTFC